MSKKTQRPNEQDKIDQREPSSAKPSTIEQVPLEAIVADSAARLINPGIVDELTKSLGAFGQINPILVMKTSDSRFNLIAGRHRLAAAGRLGWQHIDAKVVDVDDIEREILQIDENLIRAELTELEFAEHLDRRKKLFDQRGGEKFSTLGGEQKIGFDKATAAKTGRSKSAIQKARKRAEKITPTVRDKIRGTPAADKGTELDALAAMSPTKQARAAKLYINKKAGSIREARAQINAKPEPSQEVKDDRDFECIKRVWENSSPGGQQKFEAWRAQGSGVESKANPASAEADPVAASSRMEPTASNQNVPANDRDQTLATGFGNGQVHASAGEIDVDNMGKNDMLQFIASNKIKLLGLEQFPIQKMRKALKAHLQARAAPEGGWKLAEATRP